MPIPIHLDRYECEVCGIQYDTPEEATKCELSHEVVYVPLTRKDLRALWAFLASGNPIYITPSLEKTLRKYNKIIGKD